MSRLTDFIDPCRVTDGKAFRLKDVDPNDTGPFTGGKDSAIKENE